MTKKLSYHDVIVYVNGVIYKPSENYAYFLTCTKSGGWEFWYKWEGKEKLVGGEYDGGDFAIEVDGKMIVGKKPKEIRTPQQDGWSGLVLK